MFDVKSKFIFTIFALILTPKILAVEDAQDSAPVANFEQHHAEVDKLSKLLEISEVKAVYDKCLAAQVQTPDIVVSDCLWKGNGAIEGIENNESLVEKIQNKLDETLNENGINQYESVTAISLKKENTAAQKALEKFYLKKMSKEIFGEFDASGKPIGGKHKIIDHTKFNTLYQNQLTKNILTGISSFCIEATLTNNKNDPATPNSKIAFPVIKKDTTERRKIRKQNVTSLTTSAAGATTTAAELSSDKWTNCFLNAQYVCHGGERTQMENNNGAKVPQRDSSNKVIKHTAKFYLDVKATCTANDCVSEEDFNYTKKRACELTNFLKVTRQNLKTVEKISEGYNQVFAKKGVSLEATDSKMQVNTEQVTLDKKVDTLTSTTSNEFVNESGFSEAANEDLAELEKCVTKDPTTGKLTFTGDENSCKKFLNTDKEASEKLKAEHALRLRGLSAKVSKLDETTDDTKELEKYLSDQGLSKDAIGDQLANTNIKELKKQIIARYDAEKEQLIKSLNDQIDATTSKEEGKFDFADSNSKDLEKLEKIHKELSSKTESYAQLIHFNNVVSGFLDIEEKGGKKKQNTASIKRELANSAFAQDNLEGNETLKTAGYTDQNENLEESLSGVELKDDEEQGATLGVDKINTVILKYDTEE